MVQLRRFYVSGRNGTYSDDLVALGLADLLYELAGREGVTISRQGEGFAISLARPLDTDAMMVDADPYDYIRFDDKDKAAPPGHISYKAERAQEAVYDTYHKSLAKPKKGAKGSGATVAVMAAKAEDAPSPPRADLKLFKALNSMRKGSTSYQDIWRRWMELSSDERRRILTARLVRLADDLGDDVHLDEPESAAGLAKVVRALQFYDPLIGKGASRSKPNGASPASYDSSRVDWFEEFLKYRGMHVGMAAYPTGKGGTDTRAFVLSPQAIPIDILGKVRRDLLQAPVFGNAQSEIRAV